MLTLPNLLRNTVLNHGSRTAIRGDTGNLSWREYVRCVSRTAAMLRTLGLAPGQRFGILARNCVEQSQLLYGGYWCGAVPVPLNFRQAPLEIAQMLHDAECAVVFVDAGLLHLLEHPALCGYRGAAVVIPLEATAPQGLRSLPQLLAGCEPMAPHEGHEDDDALLLFTGGTTGRSKGVRLSHRNIYSNALQLSRVMSPTENDVYLHVSPMFHSTDLKATVVTMFGGAHVYMKEFSPDGVLEATQRHRVSILSIVPTMIVRVLREGRLARCDLSSLRLVSYGTSPIDEGVLREAMRAFGGHVGFHQCYGLTETSPLLAILDEASHRRGLDDRPDLLRATGRVLPGVLLRFLDEDGRDTEVGEPGEVVVRGPQVCKGYLNRPEENAAAFRDGWFHTGDIGRVDDDGYLHILGRRKDMVITGGENVYTREVERVLEQHAAVAEVAVVGVPDEQYGEALLGVIVPANGVADPPEPAELIAFCRSQLGGYKIPRRYVFVSQLPRTALGKVQKHELAALWKQRDQKVSA